MYPLYGYTGRPPASRLPVDSMFRTRLMVSSITAWMHTFASSPLVPMQGFRDSLERQPRTPPCS